MKHAIPIAILALCIAIPGRAQDRQLLTMAVAQSASPATVTATGRLQAVVSARIGARVNGHIVEWAQDDQGRMLDVGMSVKAGQILFKINPTTFENAMASAQAALNSSQAALTNLTAKPREEKLDQLRAAVAELDVRIADRKHDEERYKRLVEVEKTLPARRLEEVQTELAAFQAQRKAADARLQEVINGPTKSEVALAEARVKEAEAALKIASDDLRDTAVKAPFDGLITRRFKGMGDYVANMPLVEVIELVAADKLEAELRLPEAYLSAVAAGTTQVLLRSGLLKGELKLPITRVVGDVDPARGTFAVRIAVPPAQRGDLVAGAFVAGDVSVGESMGVIVPQQAVVTIEGKPAAFVAVDGKMVRRAVELGDKLTEGVIVKSGIRTGDKVIMGPPASLQDGAVIPPYLAGK